MMETCATLVFFWLTREGTYLFTDDEKKVPKAYQQEVQQVCLMPLEEYERYTHIEQKD